MKLWKMFFTVLLSSAAVMAAVSVTIDTTTINKGWMNVYTTNNVYEWGNAWNIAALRVSAAGTSTVTFAPCVISTNQDPTYWYVDGTGAALRIMEANWYAETEDMPGETLTFGGILLSNTLAAGYTVNAFIKDFAPDYSSMVATEVDLTGSNSGPFSITYTFINASGRHQQWGLQMRGLHVKPEEADNFGVITVTAIPEPGIAMGMASLALVAWAARWCRHA